MAAFRIHEDIHTYLPKNKVEQKETKIAVKRIPLRNTNNVVNKNYVKNDKKQSKQPVEKIQIYKEPPREVKEKKINLQIIQEITSFNDIENKENIENDPVHEKFYFPVDNFFVTTMEYHDSIYHYLLTLEKSLRRPKIDYLMKQPELSPKMRSILVDWLSSVVEEYNMQPQTLHLAVQYVDCFLSRMSVVKSKFQLVGTAAMMIAAKYEEIYPPNTKEWAYLTADTFSPKQLLRMEQLILKVLQFDLAQPTTYLFISHICFVCNLPKKLMFLAMYFSELILLEGEDYIKYFPSELGSAAVALARHTLQEKELWPEFLETKTGYNLRQLSPLIVRQNKSFRDSPTRNQQAIQDKYKTCKYGRVALFQPKEFALEFMEE